jgi:competence protein ComFC
MARLIWQQPEADMSELQPALTGWLNAGLGFFYPEVCQLCGEERASESEGFVGPKCWQRVRFIRRPFCERCGLPFEGDITTKFECGNCRDMELHFSFARSAVVAKGPVLDVIHRYKYHQALWFEPFLADLLIREAASELRTAKWDMIVPVPLHSAKQREREFNQAERISDCLADQIGIPVRTNLLKRIQPTQTQTLLSKQQRAENVRRAFAPANRAQLSGEKVVLVDDVFTTGATTSACARILKHLGAGDVCVWTVARGL